MINEYGQHKDVSSFLQYLSEYTADDVLNM